MMYRLSLIVLLLTCTLIQVHGQSDQEEAMNKGREAIKLMDTGDVDASLKLLKEAQKLDPDNFLYPYEMAYANYLKANYKEAIKILEKLKGHKNESELLYQLLGNSYHMAGKESKAFEAYGAGLDVFPNSGIIYLEIGNVHLSNEAYNDALAHYEKGIEVDPSFPSNYYRATLLYCNSNVEVWGMIYGEIFMNLERNSPRTAEISKILYDTYKSEISITSDTSMTVSFCAQMSIDASSLSGDGEFKLPFCMIYEPTMLLSVILEPGELNLASLHHMRQTFVETYYRNGHHGTHPNMLFSYQHKVLEAGHMEAYNHWILMQGDLTEFENWQEANPEKWEAFVDWFMENGLVVNQENRFYSSQY